MSKLIRAALQLLRAVLGLLAVLWIFSWIGIFLKIAEPGFLAANWAREILAFGVTLIPVWGYTKLTKILAAPRTLVAENASANRNF